MNDGGRKDNFLGCSSKEWGETARQEIGTARRRFPFTHGSNLENLLALADEELGNFCLANPIISRVNLYKEQFWEAVEKEEARRWLRKWIERVPFLYAAEKFELSLFTNGQELICGICRSRGEVEKKVIRKLRVGGGIGEEQVQQRVGELKGLIPSIDWFLSENEVLVLVDFIEGREPAEEEVGVFKQSLRERGFNPEAFDLNKGNLKVDSNGNIFLIDPEDIILRS